jgi:hypothetical protein
VSAIKHVDVARARGLQGVEDHRGRLGAGLLRDDGHLIALRPDLQLFARRGAEGVAGGQHHGAALGQQADAPICRWWWSCRRR